MFRRALLLAGVFLLLPVTAAAKEGACKYFEGMWQPLYRETYALFPDMRQYMDGPGPARDSFARDMFEARRIVIDCKTKRIQSVQGMEASEPRPFNIDFTDKGKMVINFIAPRFINPDSDTERSLAEELKNTAPRTVFIFDGDLLNMYSTHESFVLRRADSVERRR